MSIVLCPASRTIPTRATDGRAQDKNTTALICAEPSRRFWPLPRLNLQVEISHKSNLVESHAATVLVISTTWNGMSQNVRLAPPPSLSGYIVIGSWMSHTRRARSWWMRWESTLDVMRQKWSNNMEAHTYLQYVMSWYRVHQPTRTKFLFRDLCHLAQCDWGKRNIQNQEGLSVG